MDRLRCIEVFLEVARAGSFSAAALHLGISRANVTRHIAWLEHVLDARLIDRTTSQLRLTEVGVSALENGEMLIERYDAMEAGARASIQGLKGIIRVGTPPAFGSIHLIKPIAAFIEQHPEVQIFMTIDLGSADLIKHGLDVSVRIGAPPKDSSYISVPLMKAPQALVAAPSYLARKGTPKTPADLQQHNCLVHSIKSPSRVWCLQGPANACEVRVSGSITSNFGEVLKSSTLMGHGISLQPCYLVSEEISAGRLAVVLPQFRPQDLEIYLIFPTRQSLPVRVRSFVAFLREWARHPQSWTMAPQPRAAQRPAQAPQPKVKLPVDD